MPQCTRPDATMGTDGAKGVCVDTLTGTMQILFYPAMLSIQREAFGLACSAVV